MATDFADYSNFRFLWARPAAIEDLRSGVPVSTDRLVIEAFLKGDTPTLVELPSIKVGTLVLDGFITRWAVVPEDTDWLAASSAFSWDTTGLMPDQLRPEDHGPAVYGNLPALPSITNGSMVGRVTVAFLGGSFGVGGIGAELRLETGDAIRVHFAIPT